MKRLDTLCADNFIKALLGGAGAAALAAGASPAWAQDGQAAPAAAEPAPPAIEEVVVTARQRSEGIQQVPAQVTAFTEQAITSKGIGSPSDFLSAVPNVTFVATQNAGTSFIVIRGISQARNSEPSVSVVVDGVPMTQPAQFNQALLDIKQIEVLKGPQGALYGRNAIGGAILITTQPPGDEWETKVTAGYESGPGVKLQGVAGGPLSDTLKMRAAVYYFDTDGHLKNEDRADGSAARKADPVKDFNARLSFLYQPTTDFSADLRLSTDLLNTRGLYYVIPDFGSPRFNDPNFTGQPINLNNSGRDVRKIYDGALKLNYDAPYGVFTSITGYSTVWESLTGDGYPFDPFGQSRIAFDFAQSQFLTAKTFSQEVRFTSPSDRRFRWIVGGQFFKTKRYISTGNMFDVADEGVQPIYRTPNPAVFQPQGQISFLADSQDQLAWAGYLDTSTNLTDKLELSLNVRYDHDRRKNTTETPQAFLTAAGIPATTGETRSHTWSEVQPQVILRYEAMSNFNVYASYGRGFRSGGFNQTGVATAAAAAGFDNVGDLFDAETATTYEAGFKSRWLENRLTLNASAYTTSDQGAYYFVFLASNSTQNLGNIKKARLNGVDIDASMRFTRELTGNLGFGYTDSEIIDFPGASSALVKGSKVPLVSDYTLNASLQYTHELANGWEAMLRADDNLIGPTTFVIPVPAVGEPKPIARHAVNLLDLRASLNSDAWTLTVWSKNVLNKRYNTEYSTGGFLFKGQPRTWGVDLTHRF
ncbi:TonB-dependent receptor [Phenylobacterium sp.]|uniref:TonB-dependent receptor n=1 Tax=Phenylobacterium sp. TaxID=1871053 RepID=UPI0035AF2AF5